MMEQLSHLEKKSLKIFLNLQVFFRLQHSYYGLFLSAQVQGITKSEEPKVTKPRSEDPKSAGKFS